MNSQQAQSHDRWNEIRNDDGKTTITKPAKDVRFFFIKPKFTATHNPDDT